MTAAPEVAINPEELPTLVLSHLDALMALLHPLRPASDLEYYVTVDDDGEGVFTEHAYLLAKRAHEYARDVGSAMWAVAGTIPPSKKALDDLAYEAGYALAAVAAALGGIREVRLPSPVIGGVLNLLDGVRDSCAEGRT